MSNNENGSTEFDIFLSIYLEAQPCGSHWLCPLKRTEKYTCWLVSGQCSIPSVLFYLFLHILDLKFHKYKKNISSSKRQLPLQGEITLYLYLIFYLLFTFFFKFLLRFQNPQNDEQRLLFTAGDPVSKGLPSAPLFKTHRCRACHLQVSLTARPPLPCDWCRRSLSY